MQERNEEKDHEQFASKAQGANMEGPGVMVKKDTCPDDELVIGVGVAEDKLIQNYVLNNSPAGLPRPVRRSEQQISLKLHPFQATKSGDANKGKAKAEFGDESRWEELIAPDAFPFGRPKAPEEVAALAAMLASPRVQYLSGTVVDLDGGGQWLG